MNEVSRRFRAMNTDVVAVVVAPDRPESATAALREVEALFVQVEATLSRFRPESELSQMNRRAGEPFHASPLLFAVVAAALEVARATKGVFDPTILGALVAAGYDRSFENVPPELDDPVLPPIGPRPRWRDVHLVSATRTIVLPKGAGLDLGGIGKGWTVDRAMERLGIFAGFGIDAGGDLSCRGTRADGRPWTVGIQDPRQPDRDLAVLAVREGAVATSTVARRHWYRAGEAQHHLIDPRTGRPGRTDVRSATVLAGAAVRAETLAKVALLLGSREGSRFLDDQTDAAGLLALGDGRVVRSARFPEIQHER
ncbi:MAG: FAD:protein FMN transferase [Chloroflexota bacterium]